MSWIWCCFMMCDWIHHFNVQTAPNKWTGIYQCSRCKTISVGGARNIL